MNQRRPGVFQRRIVIGAALCVVAFALVGVRLVDVTLLNGGVTEAHRDTCRPPSRCAPISSTATASCWRAICRSQDLYARPHAFWDKEQPRTILPPPRAPTTRA